MPWLYSGVTAMMPSASITALRSARIGAGQPLLVVEVLVVGRDRLEIEIGHHGVGRDVFPDRLQDGLAIGLAADASGETRAA